MINIEGTTKLSEGEVIESLKKYFGKGGQGLEITDEQPSCLTFAGGGGNVTATVCPEGEKTRVNLVAQEWEYQARQFISQLP
ncbi:MAG: hypothetical protein HY787_15605 [Deltaproteobacteria bacterium]|nr:hypothetical protein [Deltaproteobacteria bacterium]